MTFKEFLGLNAFDFDVNGKQWSHQEKHTTIVMALGFDRVRALLPFSKEELAAILPYNEHLNGWLGRDFSWSLASGFRNLGANCVYIGSPLTCMYRSIGVTSFSSADGVCILKQCARMMAEEWDEFEPSSPSELNSLYAQ